jgi:cell division protein FtsA
MNPISNQDSKITVGLDIGSKRIKCAIGQIQNSTKPVKLLGFSEIESSGIKKGIIINRDELIDKIEKVVNNAEVMADVKVTSLTLSITGEHIKCLNTQAAISLNYVNGVANASKERVINKNDILQVLNSSQSISLPIDRDILHTIPQEYSVDTLEEIKNPIGMTGRRLESKVHLITAATAAMNNFVSCVEELGLSVNALVFQPLASSLSTLKKDEMELGITLVDLGYSTTNIAVYHKGSIRHSGIIPIGSKSITNDIAVMLQIGIEESEKIKVKYASALASMSSSGLNINVSNNTDEEQRSVSENEISKYVEARMLEIFQMVIQEISRADVKDPLTYGIVLTGGGASLRNIIPLLENSLGIKVRLGKSNIIDGAKDIADGPSYATSMGLLLWELYDIDYSHLQKKQEKGLIGIIKRIRNTIENMF